MSFSLAMMLKKFYYQKVSKTLNGEFPVEKKDGSAYTHKEIGEIGERVAAHYLYSIGLKVLYKNFKNPKGGEVDIVARDGSVLSFIEVKTRTSKSDFHRPLDAVDKKKQSYIIKGAKAWRRMLAKDDYIWRYDVIEVYLLAGKEPEINLVREAFTESEQESRAKHFFNLY